MDVTSVHCILLRARCHLFGTLDVYLNVGTEGEFSTGPVPWGSCSFFNVFITMSVMAETLNPSA